MTPPAEFRLPLPQGEGDSGRLSDVLLAVVLHGLAQRGAYMDEKGLLIDAGTAAVRLVQQSVEARRKAIKQGYWP